MTQRGLKTGRTGSTEAIKKNYIFIYSISRMCLFIGDISKVKKYGTFLLNANCFVV